ncbi:hypothetical protein [Streptomyces sp. YGL11-2]|uniref:hypothetical protein n=1 Tax=Streptomyces sp. YGL11-2 TaxID=3414028 RepID=UPI003CFAFA75
MISIAVIGTGSLARSVCYALASLLDAPAQVAVIGRSEAQLRELCYVASTRASLIGREVAFHPCPDPLENEGRLALTLTGTGAELVLCCASRQSPWEHQSAPSAWTSLTQATGLAMTLPLNADIALLTARALTRLPGHPALINACYPDAVNPLLAANGVPVLTGVGNAALVASSLRQGLSLDREAELRVIAHHVHLYAPEDPGQEARAWLGDREIAGVGRLLAAQRAASRPELNTVTGFHTALVVRALVQGETLRTSLPGPGGRPGGYPVVIQDGRVELDLPDSVGLDEAAAWNREWARQEGVVVDPDRGTIEFSDHVNTLVSAHLPDWAGAFTARESGAVAEQLHRLRDRLRRQLAF